MLLVARLLVADVLMTADVVENPKVVGLCGVVVVVVVDVAAAVVDEVSFVTFGMAMGKVNIKIKKIVRHDILYHEQSVVFRSLH